MLVLVMRDILSLNVTLNDLAQYCVAFDVLSLEEKTRLLHKNEINKTLFIWEFEHAEHFWNLILSKNMARRSS